MALLSTGFLADVLFTPKSLSGFDVLLSHSVWNWQNPYRGMHQPLLSDSPTAHYPERRLTWDALRAGQNLAYNVYGFSGFPWNSQGVGAFATSLWQLFMDVPSAIDWSTWLRLLLAGFFMYLLLHALGLGFWPSMLGGVLWAFNLQHVVWLTFPQHLATQLWIPLLFLLNLRLLRHGLRPADMLGLILVNALFVTSGYMLVVLYTYVFIGLFNTVYLLGASEPWAHKVRRWLGVHLVFVAAALLVAPTVLQDALSIAEGLRGARARGLEPLAIGIGTSLLEFLRSLLPSAEDLALALAPNLRGGLWGERYFGRANIIEAASYFSAVAVVLAALALVRYRRAPSCLLLGSTALVLCLLLSIYHQNPVALWAIDLIPLSDRSGHQRGVLPLVLFAAIVLAAHGAHALFQDLGRGRLRRPSDIVPIVVLGAFLVAPAGIAWLAPDISFANFRYTWIVLGSLALALLCALVVLRFRRWLAPIVVAIVAIDLFAVGYHFNTRMEHERIFPLTDVIRFLQADPQPYRVAQLSRQMPYHPNALSWYRIPEVAGYEVVAPVRYLQLVRALFDDLHLTRNGILFLFSDNDRALRMLGVHYAISDRHLDESTWELMLINDSSFLYRLRDALDRVYCASDRIEAPNDAAGLVALRQALQGMDRPLVLVGHDSSHLPLTERCVIEDLNVYNTGVSFRVRSDAPSFVLIPYNWHRSWEAWIDGSRVPLLRANHSLGAVAIGVGTSDVLIRYRHPFERWQALAFFLFLVVTVAAGALGYLPRRTAFLMIAVCAVVAGKASLSVPGLGSERLPERTAVAPDRPPETVGIRRDDPASPSPRVTASDPFEGVFTPPLDWLTAFRFYVGTYHQAKLPYSLVVEVTDDEGTLVVRALVSGEDVRDNEFVRIDLPAVEDSAGRTFHFRIIPENDNPNLAFALWLDDSGEPLLATFHDAARVHGY